MLRKLGTALLGLVVVCGSGVWFLVPSNAWGQGTDTHVVLTNDQDFTLANDKYLSGFYECGTRGQETGHIAASCLVGTFGPAGSPGNIQINGGNNQFGVFPGTMCAAGYAIQALDVNGVPPSCIFVGPAGSDTWVNYNNAGMWGADQNFTWNFTTDTLSIGAAAATTGFQTFGGGALASLGTPADGTITYCNNCAVGTDPCTASSTGAIATRLGGRWFCAGGAAGSGSVSSVGLSMPGTIWSVGGSPVTTSGTLAVSVAGTSGGVPYFSSASAMGSSAALANTHYVIGGGAGAAPSSVTQETYDSTGINGFIHGVGTISSSTGGVGEYQDMTTSASGSSGQYGIRGVLEPGYTGATVTEAGRFENYVHGTGTGLNLDGGFPGAIPIGVFGAALNDTGTASGYKVGGYFYAGTSTGLNIGVVTNLNDTSNGPNIGVDASFTVGGSGSFFRGIGLYAQEISVGDNLTPILSSCLGLTCAGKTAAVLAYGSSVGGDFSLVVAASKHGNALFAIDTDGNWQVSNGGGSIHSAFTGTKTIRASGGASDCNMVYVNGVATVDSTC